MPGQEPTVEIVVCMGSSCFSRGNSSNLTAIQDYLRDNALAARVTIVGSRCEEQCMHGPVIRVNGELICGVAPDSLPQILSSRLLPK